MKIFFKLLFLFAGLASHVYAQADQSDLYWRKAEKLSIDGKYSESLKYYQMAYQLVKDIDPIRAANLCNDMSSAYFGDQNYKTALQYCRKGLGHIGKMPVAPDSLFFKLYSSLGTMHNALRERDTSYHFFQLADAVLDRNAEVEKNIPSYVLYHYLHQGRAFWALHRYNQSIAYFLKAKRLSEKYNLPEDLASIESSIGEVYDLLGKHQEALKYRNAAIHHNNLNSKRKQILFSGVAYTYHKLAQPNMALEWHKMSWEQHLLQDPNTELYKKEHLRLLFLIGSCFRQKGQLKNAESYLNNAMVYHSKNLPGERWIMANILIEKGKLAQKLLQLTEAEAYYSQAFKTVSLSPNSTDVQPIDLVYPQIAFQALYLRAKLLSDHYAISKQPNLLLDSYKSFRELIALKRLAYFEASQDTEERYFLSEESNDLFKEAIPIGYELYQKSNSPIIMQEVFNWFEDANASYLFEVVRDKNLYHKNVSAEIIEQEQKLIQKRAVLAGSVRDSTGKIEREISDLRLQWYKLKQKIAMTNGSKTDTFHEPIKILAVQEKLDDRSAYISYKWFGNEIYAFVITADASQLIRWKIDQTALLSNLSLLQKECTISPVFENYHGVESGIYCYKALFEPLKKYLSGKSRLVVGRDWQFNFLPLEILETGKKKQDYLIKYYSLSYAYSAALFWQHPSMENNLRIQSASKFSKWKSSIIFAPFVKEQGVKTSQELVDGWNPVSSLEDLEEIGGESVWGEKATKQEFLKSGFNHQILQLATHAKADDKSPDDSYIQFYPGPDSRLYMSEIYSLPLNSTRLMILSACAAGEGKNVRGEGNISLAHAIAQAGCPSVITTIWEAQEGAASFLSCRLYKYIEDGEPIDIALQKVKSDFFKDKKLAQFYHPYYWANLVLIGSNEPVNTQSIHSYFDLETIIVGVLFLTLCLYFLNKALTKRSGRFSWWWSKVKLTS